MSTLTYIAWAVGIFATVGVIEFILWYSVTSLGRWMRNR